VLHPNEGKRSIALAVYQHPGDGFVEIGNVTIPANVRIPAVGSLVDARYFMRTLMAAYISRSTRERNDVDAADSVKSLKFKQGENDEG